jgi:hypothetical protein
MNVMVAWNVKLFSIFFNSEFVFEGWKIDTSLCTIAKIAVRTLLHERQLVLPRSGTSREVLTSSETDAANV